MRKRRTITRREQTGNWRVIAASVTGTSHEKSEQPGQDAFFSQQTAEGRLFAAVADGAGSAALGEVGARLAVATAVETLVCDYNASEPEACLRRALSAARERLEQEAEQRGIALRELATTLIVMMAAPDSIAVAQVGDGAVVMQNGDGRLRPLTTPPETDYINETVFLTAPDALDLLQAVVHSGPVVALAAFTDGLQRLALKLPEGEPHAPFFIPLFHFLHRAADIAESEAQLVAFLRSPRITERADDDLTLFLATFLYE